MKNISILGSTGSIGIQALIVAAALQDKISVKALAAHSNAELLKKQIIKFSPDIACIFRDESFAELKAWALSKHIKTKILSGHAGLIECAKYGKSEIILSAIVGSAGLEPLISAIKSGKIIALANKEALVVAGELIEKLVKQHNSKIIPVDSEHSAIFQSLNNEEPKAVAKIILTASGGPFYRYKADHAGISVDRALAHPTWQMGKKITVDSATLMNKGLEAIEASHLFNVPLSKIDILIHPQSIIHSLVEFVDSSVIAQLSVPDMGLPIQYALTYPARLPSRVKRLNLASVGKLEFDRPDFVKFPCLDLAIGAGKAGGTAPAAMNAANEVAVEAFLNNEILFTDIARVVSKTLEAHKTAPAPSLEDIIFTDTTARRFARNLIENRCPKRGLL